MSLRRPCPDCSPPGHPMGTLLKAVLLVPGFRGTRTHRAGNHFWSYSRALRAHKVSCIPFSPLPSFIQHLPCASVSLIRTDDTPPLPLFIRQLPRASVSLIGPKDLPPSGGLITLSCCLPAPCFSSHPPTGWDSAGASHMLKSQDSSRSLVHHLDSYSLLTVPPEDTDNCLNLIPACLLH